MAKHTAQSQPYRLPTSIFLPKNIWLICIIIISFLPLFQALVTWDRDGEMTAGYFAIRHFSVPAVIGEIAIIFIAFRSQMQAEIEFAALTKWIKIFAAIWAVFAIAATFSNQDQLPLSILMLARYALHGLFFLSLIFITRHADGLDSMKWLRLITLGGVAYAASISIFAFLVPDPVHFRWILRLPSATNVRQIGDIIGIITVAPVALLLFDKNNKPALYMFALFALMAFIGWTGTRSVLFAMIFALPLASLFIWRRLDWQRAAYTGIAALAGLIASLPLPRPSGEFGLMRMAVSVSGKQDISSGRLDIWHQTAQEIIRSPILGHGAGRFNKNMYEAYGYDFNHPHNFVLQYLYDWGVLGGVAGLLLIALLGISIIRTPAHDSVNKFAAVAGFLMLLIIAGVDGALFYPLPIMLSLALIAPLLSKQQS